MNKPPKERLVNLSDLASLKDSLRLQRKLADENSAAPFGLSGAQWTTIVDAICDCRYNLLLGAGASKDAIGGDGAKLPLADELRIEICSRFALSQSDLPSLSDVYEEAQALGSRDGHDLRSFMLGRFTKCKPVWQSALFEIPWRRIWNLNIDDVCERAWAECGKPKQNLVPVIWNSRFGDTQDDNEVQLVYLHGRALGLQLDEGHLVFSIREYARLTAQPGTWHRVFSDIYQTQPFIVLGARLKDEIDLADALRSRNISEQITNTPSLFISRSVSETERNRLKRWGMTAIEATAEEFVERLKIDVLARLGAGPLGERESMQLRKHLECFDRLHEEAESLIERRVDFWSGVEPVWEDVIDGKIVQLEQYQHLQNLVDDCARALEKVTVVWIRGQPASGKSASGLFLVRRFQSLGAEAWLFRNRRRIDIPSFVSQLRPGRTYCAVFEHAADMLQDLEDLVRQLKLKCSSTTRVSLILVERSRKLDLMNLAPELQSDRVFECARLVEADAKAVIDALSAEGRLGELTGLAERKQIQFFTEKNGGSLFDSLMDLKLGGAYRKRIHEQLESIPRELDRKILAITAIPHYFGYSVPISILARAVGLSASEVVDFSRGSGIASEYLVVEKAIDAPCMRTLHRRRAELIVEDLLSPEERYEFAGSIARICATYLSLKTIRRRDLPYQIVRNLFDRNVVERWYGLKAREWYSDLEALYGWNARFWEQRALFESGISAHERAISFARTAKNLHLDNFTLNTLGTVLLNAALESIPVDWEGFREAEGCLLESRVLTESRGGSNLHPFVTFFSKSLSLVKSARLDDSGRAWLASRWKEWIAVAVATHRKVRNPEFGKLVDEAIQGWDRAFASTGLGSATGGQEARAIAQSQVRSEKDSQSKLSENKFLLEAIGAAIEAAKGSDGWSSIQKVGYFLTHRFSDSPGKYGYTKWPDLIRATDCFQIEVRQHNLIYVRKKR